MNLKSVRIFHNSQRQSSQEKLSPTLHNLTQRNESTNKNLTTVNESHNTATNNFLDMFEIEVKKHWGI